MQNSPRISNQSLEIATNPQEYLEMAWSTQEFPGSFFFKAKTNSEQINFHTGFGDDGKLAVDSLENLIGVEVVSVSSLEKLKDTDTKVVIWFANLNLYACFE